jgi:hypothetical protein
MSLKSKLPFFMMLGAMFDAAGIGVQPYKRAGSDNIPHHRDRKQVIPKGCKIFYFASDGSFQMSKSYQYSIEIVALNQKNAIRKFQKRIQ